MADEGGRAGARGFVARGARCRRRWAARARGFVGEGRGIGRKDEICNVPLAQSVAA